MMRLASRDVCDDETWANTVLNRSSCSVQERLCMLESETWIDVRQIPRRSERKRLAFAPMDHVLIFEKDVLEHHLDDSDSSEDDNDENEDDHTLHQRNRNQSHSNHQRAWPPLNSKRSLFAEFVMDTFDSPDISLDGW